MIGLFIIHPKKPHTPYCHKDFGVILQEWALLPNNPVPNSLAMEFNWLTINGKAGPATTPMIVKQGERVRIRMVNLGMDHHPMHIHGNQFYVTGTEGGRIPETGWFPGNTVLVGVAQARDVEFDAVYPGDWMLHCHLPHHMMNQMVSMVGPISHAGHGMQTGGGMEEGMGIVRQGHALSEDMAPKFGRGMGDSTEQERNTSNIVGPNGQQGQMNMQQDAGKKRVPGYPQDMIMIMDKEVAKPHTYGLPPGWTASMMGMMTLIRVLPPNMYDEVQRRIKAGIVELPAAVPGHNMDRDALMMADTVASFWPPGKTIENERNHMRRTTAFTTLLVLAFVAAGCGTTQNTNTNANTNTPVTASPSPAATQANANANVHGNMNASEHANMNMNGNRNRNANANRTP